MTSIGEPLRELRIPRPHGPTAQAYACFVRHGIVTRDGGDCHILIFPQGTMRTLRGRAHSSFYTITLPDGLRLQQVETRAGDIALDIEGGTDQ